MSPIVQTISCFSETAKYFEKARGIWLSNDFLKFKYQISIEFQIRNTLLQKFLQTDMIFFDQLIVATVKFRDALRSL